MPEWVWIPIVVLGGLGFSAFVVAMLARGGAMSIGKNTFVLHGDEKEPANPLARALQYIPENIGQISDVIYGHYLKMVRQNGIERDEMTEIDDTRFARLGNGFPSVQKILEADIASRDWVGMDLETHIRRSVVPRAVHAIRAFVNSEYDTVAHASGHESRSRIVSQADFVDILLSDDLQEDLTKSMLPFYRFAQHCMNGGEQ